MQPIVLTEDLPRQLSYKHCRTIRNVQASKASLVLGGPYGGRLGRHEPQREAVLGARRHLGRQEARPEVVWGARRSLGGRLGRQEARPEAAWAARKPVTSVLPTVRAKNAGLAQAAVGDPAAKF